jgi:hypothetical protein
LERIVGLYEKLTGIRIQNVQEAERRDEESEMMVKYHQFEMKQKASAKSIDF